jgi:hypothetical protein
MSITSSPGEGFFAQEGQTARHASKGKENNNLIFEVI